MKGGWLHFLSSLCSHKRNWLRLDPEVTHHSASCSRYWPGSAVVSCDGDGGDDTFFCLTCKRKKKSQLTTSLPNILLDYVGVTAWPSSTLGDCFPSTRTQQAFISVQVFERFYDCKVICADSVMDRLFITSQASSGFGWGKVQNCWCAISEGLTRNGCLFSFKLNGVQFSCLMGSKRLLSIQMLLRK